MVLVNQNKWQKNRTETYILASEGYGALTGTQDGLTHTQLSLQCYKNYKLCVCWLAFYPLRSQKSEHTHFQGKIQTQQRARLKNKNLTDERSFDTR